MSVIAWDGKTMAADKRVTIGTLIRTTTKIFKVDKALVGYAGDTDVCGELLAWFSSGADPEKYPTWIRDKDIWGNLMVVWPDGDVWKFERSGHPIKFPPQQFAIGCGRDYALAAMHLGKTAAEAVEVACTLDSGCGNGVDVLEHGND